MKLWISILVSIVCFTVTCRSQQYHVSSVNGDAQCLKEGRWSVVSPREILSGSDMIRIGENSALSVVDRKESKLYSLGAANEAQLSKIIKAQSSSVVSKFIDNLWRSLTRGDTEKISFDANVVYKDIVTDGRIYAALTDPSYMPSYPLSMVLVDMVNGYELIGEMVVGRKFMFRVTNDSGRPLYVNVLDIASDGSYYDCLPMDKGGTMLHLLIPAYSTVDLDGYPMAASEPKGVDSLILIGADRPFDLRNVIKMFEEEARVEATPEALGVFKTTLNVK